MSTKTLLEPPKQVVRRSEAPAELYPNRARLVTKLSEVQACMSTLEEFRARLARCGVDEASSLENDGLSETESAEQLALIQTQKGVLGARLSAKEAAETKLLKELQTANQASHGEFSILWREVLDERRRILRARVHPGGTIGR